MKESDNHHSTDFAVAHQSRLCAPHHCCLQMWPPSRWYATDKRDPTNSIWCSGSTRVLHRFITIHICDKQRRGISYFAFYLKFVAKAVNECIHAYKWYVREVQRSDVSEKATVIVPSRSNSVPESAWIF